MLLKNEEVLPFKRTVKRVVVLGLNADRLTVQGGGSARPLHGVQRGPSQCTCSFDALLRVPPSNAPVSGRRCFNSGTVGVLVAYRGFESDFI